MRILVVDAANRTRSPVAERVLRALVAEDGIADHVSVWSAALDPAHAGAPPDPRAAEVCRARGAPLDGFAARAVEDRDFQLADLVLAMDAADLAAARARCPDGCPVRIRLFLEGGEIADPPAGAAGGFEAMLERIEEGARAILEELDLGAHAEDSIGY